MEQHQILKIRKKEGLSRFANSTIHQNMVNDETEIKVLYALDKKVGIQSFIGKVVDLETAKEIAANSKENSDFVSLPDPNEAGDVTFRGSFSDVTAEASPGTRAELIKESIGLCQDKGLQAAGYLVTGFREIEVENSLGVKRQDRTSFAEFAITATGDGTGYATGTAFDLSMLNLKDLTSEACECALNNVDQTEITPGRYKVLLEPLAVHELFQFLSYIGLSGLFYDEERSCFSGMLDQEVTSPLLTFYDEPISDLPGIGFDVEGVARKKTVLVEKGILKNVTYDSYSAHKVGKMSTGNAFFLLSPYGGFPFSISLTAGESNLDDMITSVEKGLLIKRFWYTRVVSPKEGILTGMTRDGTFLIDKGKVGRPVKNLRFQISLPEVLKNVKLVSNTTRLYDYGRFPHLVIDDFTITGMTG